MSKDSSSKIIGAAIWNENLDISDFLATATGETPVKNNEFRMTIENTSGAGVVSGKILSGNISIAHSIAILPGAQRTKIEKIRISGKDVDQVKVGDSIEIEFSSATNVSIGGMICNADAPVEVADQFETTIHWVSPEPMMAGRPYSFKATTNELDGSITAIKYSLNPDSDEHIAASYLKRGDTGVCNISLSGSIPFESNKTGCETSQFRIFDKETNEQLGIGVIHFALRRASNVHWQALEVTRETRAKLKGQRPAILWFTGLSGSGKSAIANIVEKKLTAMGRHAYTLDGDNIRHGLNRDLGFTDVDRVENIRRIGEVSRLMADSGLITLVSFISPFRAERQLARDLAEDGEFIEIHVDTPLEVAEARDVKGLYKKARAGEIKNFTGLDSPYEAPEYPEIRVDTIETSAEDAAELILEKLYSWGMLK